MKKRDLKSILIITFLFFMPNFAHAFNLDETVDDEIRKNYNDTKLTEELKTIGKTDHNEQSEDLPALPNIIKQPQKQKSSDIKSSAGETISVPKQIPYTKGNILVKKGTSFAVVSSNAISDYQVKGTKVKFTVKNPVYGKGYTIPAWTTFNGEIIESHQPQISCNGGLVAIQVYSMNYKGQTVPLNGYIIRANDKKVFFNDIKGQRTYLKTMWKKGNWGRTLFNRMLTLTINLGSEGSTLVLSPFPLAYGAICLGANTITSPITAFFSKGGHVSIPSGSNFKIKLLEDAYID